MNMETNYVTREQVEQVREYIFNREKRRSPEVDSMILRQICIYLGIVEDVYGCGCILKDKQE
jgi:hypothetical protein